MKEGGSFLPIALSIAFFLCYNNGKRTVAVFDEGKITKKGKGMIHTCGVE